jgi:hypothetical protein
MYWELEMGSKRRKGFEREWERKMGRRQERTERQKGNVMGGRWKGGEEAVMV